ncbi:MAG: AbrB/MazE/SpoVT family DNA-binding domain-containing protein [Candidatus Limnocylindrales bacterium]
MANVVGERFQITIDKQVRQRLGIKPGDRAVEHVIDGRLVVDFIPAPHRESLRGIFKRPGQPVVTDWQALRDRAWGWRSAEATDDRSPGSEDR